MSAVFVTGGAGYIGSHVCKRLKEQGFLPIAYDDLSTGDENFVKWGPFIKGDLGDKDVVGAAFKEYRPVAVIHLAGYTNMRESLDQPTSYYENNVCKTIDLLDCMTQHKIPYCIFSSSCSVYGNPQKIPLDETHPLDPQTPYSKSKYMIELVLRDLPMKYASLRYFNAAGADESGLIGENHEPETHIIPLVIQAALNEGGSLSIFGKDYETHDGTAVRDFIHVTDLAEAHVRALNFLMDKKESIEVNLGSGKGSSILDVITTFEEISGKTVPHSFEPRFKYDPPILIANYQLAKKLLDWEPQHSDLETIIKSSYHWQQQFVLQ